MRPSRTRRPRRNLLLSAPSRGLFLEGAEHRVVGLVSHVDSWLEFGAARWGGGAVDPLGVVRERLCRQLPDDGAGVGGPGGDELVDAVGIALIYQQADRECGLCWVGGQFTPHGGVPLGDRDVLL